MQKTRIIKSLSTCQLAMSRDLKPQAGGLHSGQTRAAQKESLTVANPPNIAAVTKVCDNRGLRSNHPAPGRLTFAPDLGFKEMS